MTTHTLHFCINGNISNVDVFYVSGKRIQFLWNMGPIFSLCYLWTLKYPGPLTSEEILNPFLASLLRFNKKLALACNLADFVF